MAVQALFAGKGQRREKICWGGENVARMFSLVFKPKSYPFPNLTPFLFSRCPYCPLSQIFFTFLVFFSFFLSQIFFFQIPRDAVGFLGSALDNVTYMQPSVDAKVGAGRKIQNGLGHGRRHIFADVAYIHCVSKKTGPLLPFAITTTVLVRQQQILTKIIVRESALT